MAKKKTGRERENCVRAVGDRGGGAPGEEGLRGPEEHWRSLVENIPDIVMGVGSRTEASVRAVREGLLG